MQVLLLYAMVVLIWGSTWAAITFQLGFVAEELTVAYRFGLGSLILFVYAAISGRQLRIPRNIYPFVMIMGAMMFSAGYLFIYYGTAYITSGLVAVVFSLIVVSNAFYERIFFATRIESSTRLQLASHTSSSAPSARARSRRAWWSSGGRTSSPRRSKPTRR